MAGKAVISLTTGLEDPEKVTVAFLVAVGAAESGRPTLIFQAKEAVRAGPRAETTPRSVQKKRQRRGGAGPWLRRQAHQEVQH